MVSERVRVQTAQLEDGLQTVCVSVAGGCEPGLDGGAEAPPFVRVPQQPIRALNHFWN